MHGDLDNAFDVLTALTDLERLGGSAAQREVLEDTALHCAAVAGRAADSERILMSRLARRHSPHDARRLHSLRATQRTSERRHGGSSVPYGRR